MKECLNRIQFNLYVDVSRLRDGGPAMESLGIGYWLDTELPSALLTSMQQQHKKRLTRRIKCDVTLPRSVNIVLIM